MKKQSDETEIREAISLLRSNRVPEELVREIEKWIDKHRRCARCTEPIFRGKGRWVHVETERAECELAPPTATPMKTTYGNEVVLDTEE